MKRNLKDLKVLARSGNHITETLNQTDEPDSWKLLANCRWVPLVEIEAFEKQLRDDWHCIIEEELIQFKQKYPHRLLTFDDVLAIVSKFIKAILGEEK